MPARSVKGLTRVSPREFNFGDYSDWKSWLGEDFMSKQGAFSRHAPQRRPLSRERIIDFMDTSNKLTVILQRKAVRSNRAFRAFSRGVGEVWDEIMRRTAFTTPPAERRTYGVDTRAGGSIVTFRVWWDNFTGSTESAVRRFQIRREILENWWRQASRELHDIVR